VFARIVGALALLAASAGAAAAVEPIVPEAKHAILIDGATDTVLAARDPDTPFMPASLAKLMTLAVVFDEIEAGRLTLDETFKISLHAWRTGGAPARVSAMFARVNSQVSVRDLIRGVAITIGNDAAIALAEGIAGSEATFANIENQMAEKIGLTHSHFTNASGLPDPEMHTTARDLADLARYLIKTYPEYYHIFSVKEFTWNKIRQPNRNSLLELGIGVDGLKTGHSEESGYSSVISTAQGGRRLIGVLAGLKSMAERTEEGRKLLTWGTRAFEEVSAFPKGKVVGYASVYGGREPQVGLVGNDDINFFIPKGQTNCPTANITYKGPLRPPVQQGDQVAELQVMCNGELIQKVPLFAADTVEEGGFMNKAMAALKQLALGWL
jgi:D-alanyl-D-alanine carboxypeptidase (penicillin-binding protein 5/6)